MKRFVLLAFVLFGLMIGNRAFAQDPQFSQFYANKVNLSPAFTGSGNGPRLALNFRNQWPRIPNGFRTIAASFDMPFFFGAQTQYPRHGLGINLMADQAGAGLLTRLEATFNYSFLISLGRDYDHNIRLGVAGGLRQTSIDFYRLQFPDQFGPNGVQGPTNEPIGRNGSRIREEVSAGALYYNDLFYFGTTVSHITQPDQTFIDEGSAADTELPMRITGFTGMELPLQPQRDPDGPSIQPAVSYQYQDPFQSLNIGTYVNLDPIVVGAWYQALTDNNTMTGLVGVQTGMFKIGYSYDFVVSGLGNAASGGAHEISLVVNFEGGDRKPYEPQAKMSCPKY